MAYRTDELSVKGSIGSTYIESLDSLLEYNTKTEYTNIEDSLFKFVSYVTITRYLFSS